MGYYIRFIATDSRPIDLECLTQALKAQDSLCKLEYEKNEGTLIDNGEMYTGIEINQPGDGLFDAEIEELTEFLEDARGRAKKRVLNTLGNATRIIAAQIVYGGRELDVTLERFDPVWDWLFA